MAHFLKVRPRAYARSYLEIFMLSVTTTSNLLSDKLHSRSGKLKPLWRTAKFAWLRLGYSDLLLNDN